MCIDETNLWLESQKLLLMNGRGACAGILWVLNAIFDRAVLEHKRAEETFKILAKMLCKVFAHFLSTCIPVVHRMAG